MSTDVCREIAASIGQLFTCSEVNGFVRIRTPYLYPDGDVVDLFWRESENQRVLTDLGETFRWLDTVSASRYLSNKQKRLVEDIRMTHGVGIYRGMLNLRISDTDSLAESITRLSQAALGIADLWFLTRTRSVGSVSDDIADFLKEKHIRFSRDEKIVGRFGRSRRIDFQTWHPKRNSFVEVLSTGSKAAANQKVDTVLATWVDLSQYKVGQNPTRFVALFDDTLNVWTEDNILQLQEYSDIAYWSQPNQLAEMLVS